MSTWLHRQIVQNNEYKKEIDYTNLNLLNKDVSGYDPADLVYVEGNTEDQVKEAITNDILTHPSGLVESLKECETAIGRLTSTLRYSYSTPRKTLLNSDVLSISIYTRDNPEHEESIWSTPALSASLLSFNKENNLGLDLTIPVIKNRKLHYIHNRKNLTVCSLLSNYEGWFPINGIVNKCSFSCPFYMAKDKGINYQLLKSEQEKCNEDFASENIYNRNYYISVKHQKFKRSDLNRLSRSLYFSDAKKSEYNVLFDVLRIKHNQELRDRLRAEHSDFKEKNIYFSPNLYNAFGPVSVLTKNEVKDGIDLFLKKKPNKDYLYQFFSGDSNFDISLSFYLKRRNLPDKLRYIIPRAIKPVLEKVEDEIKVKLR